MSSFKTAPTDIFLTSLKLKEMDATLLSRSILVAVNYLGLDVAKFEEAMALASFVHRKQTRALRGSMPRVHYVEHPFRVACRLLRYGVTAQNVLLAAILHDVVEDGADEIKRCFGISSTLPQGDVTDAAIARETARQHLAARFGAVATSVVIAVSNPLYAHGHRVTPAEYQAHVIEAIEDVYAALVKWSDFEDNAGSIKHNAESLGEARVAKLAAKYWPLIAIFRERLSRSDVLELLGAAGVAQMMAHLNELERSLRTFLPSEFGGAA
jgi:hypothetical protein